MNLQQVKQIMLEYFDETEIEKNFDQNSITSYKKLKNNSLWQHLKNILKNDVNSNFHDKAIKARESLNILKEFEKVLKKQIKVLEEESNFIDFKDEIKYKFTNYITWFKQNVTFFLTQLKFEYLPFKFHISNFENCFFKLNIGENHPVLNKTDTFFINTQKGEILSPHTTVLDVSYTFEEIGRYFTFGEVFRRDDDKKHLPQFTQLELIIINDKNSILSNKLSDLVGLKHLLKEMITYLYTRLCNVLNVPVKNMLYRFRPHFFPYTIPSIEMDIRCFCKHGCDLCTEGWIEILGAGVMVEKVNENIILNSRLECEEITTLAAGIGIERTLCILVNLIKEECNCVWDFYQK